MNSEVPKWSGKIEKGEVSKLNFENNYFDCIIDIQAGSCNDFSSAVDIYNEAFRVLKKNGNMYVRTYHEDCLEIKLAKK